MSLYGSYAADPLSSLDLTEYSTQESYDNSPIPAGNYPVYVERAEIKHSKTSGNPYLNIQFKVMDGPCKGRSVFDTFALWSGNTTVARQRYKTMRLAVGLNPNVGGTAQELEGNPLMINVGLQSRRDNPDQMENKVKHYRPMPTAPAAAYQAPAPQTQPPASAPTPTPAPASAHAQAPAGDLPWEM